jgi:hypothetical protein
VPHTRLFLTITSAILGDFDQRSAALMLLTTRTQRTTRNVGLRFTATINPADTDSNQAFFESVTEDGRTLGEVVKSVVTRRVRKLEGLRAYLRSYMPGKRLLSTGTGSVYADTNDQASDTYRSPITKLTQQQTYLKGR